MRRGRKGAIPVFERVILSVQILEPHERLRERRLHAARREFPLHPLKQFLHLVLDLEHASAHVQYDLDPSQIHAQVPRQVQDELKGLKVFLGVEARIALAAGGDEEVFALVETQRLRVNAVALRDRADGIRGAGAAAAFTGKRACTSLGPRSRIGFACAAYHGSRLSIPHRCSDLDEALSRACGKARH